MKLAIVGCGDVGYYVARLASLNRKIRVAACVDSNRERAAYVARKSGCKTTYSSLTELLAAHRPDAGSRSADRPDAIYLGVPHDLHLPLVRLAVESGYAVLCEKPLAHTIDDARAIAAYCEAGARIGINYQYRYDHGCYTLMQAAHSGALGAIRYIRCNVPWHREEDYFGSGDGWHAKRERAGGGTLITQGSHLLDVALVCAGGSPAGALGRGYTSVFTNTDVDDLFVGSVETDSGVAIQITSSMVANPELPATIEVYGSHGSGVYSGPERSRVRFAGVRFRKRRHPVRFYHALGRSIEGFRRWIDEDQKYDCKAVDALPVMEAVTLLYESARTGRYTTKGGNA